MTVGGGGTGLLEVFSGFLASLGELLFISFYFPGKAKDSPEIAGWQNIAFLVKHKKIPSSKATSQLAFQIFLLELAQICCNSLDLGTRDDDGLPPPSSRELHRSE